MSTFLHECSHVFSSLPLHPRGCWVQGKCTTHCSIAPSSSLPHLQRVLETKYYQSNQQSHLHVEPYDFPGSNLGNELLSLLVFFLIYARHSMCKLNKYRRCMSLYSHSHFASWWHVSLAFKFNCLLKNSCHKIFDFMYMI